MKIDRHGVEIIDVYGIFQNQNSKSEQSVIVGKSLFKLTRKGLKEHTILVKALDSVGWVTR